MPTQPPLCSVCRETESIGWCYIWVDSIGKDKRHAVCEPCCPYRIQPARQGKRLLNYHVCLWR